MIKNQKGFSPILLSLLVGIVVASSLLLTTTLRRDVNEQSSAALNTSDYELNGDFYPLIIIGSAQNSDQNTSDNTIKVPIQGKCAINVNQGEDYTITDNNCFDDQKISISMPKATYYIWVKQMEIPLPTASANICEIDEDSNSWCNTNQSIILETSGEDQAGNILFPRVDIEATGTLTKMSLFDNDLESMFFKRYSANQEIAEVRFYK